MISLFEFQLKKCVKMASKWPEEDSIALADQEEEENQSDDEDLKRAAKLETNSRIGESSFNSIFHNQNHQELKGVPHASSISDQVNLHSRLYN